VCSNGDEFYANDARDEGEFEVAVELHPAQYERFQIREGVQACEEQRETFIKSRIIGIRVHLQGAHNRGECVFWIFQQIYESSHVGF
jgi:hypothetical protein